MYDEAVHKDSKLSGARMVNILLDFAAQVHEKMLEARQAAERMQESSQKLTGAAFAKDVNLFDLSI